MVLYIYYISPCSFMLCSIVDGDLSCVDWRSSIVGMLVASSIGVSVESYVRVLLVESPRRGVVGGINPSECCWSNQPSWE